MSGKNKVAIYSVGGCGINIGSKIGQANLEAEGFAEPVTYYIDTSDANLRRTNIPMDQVFLFEGVDGSGKVRAENHAVISKNVLKILQQFQPTQFNIIISSASGGSGAIIANSLAVELRKRGEQVIMILVGTTGSHIEIDNTLKSLKSLDALADKISKPVVVHYLQNPTDAPRQVVDGQAIQAVALLLALFSGQHRELDTADLKNWLNHTRLDPQLVSLQFPTGSEQYALAGEVITVATLATPEMNTTLDPVPAYQAVGYVPEGWNAQNASVKLIGDQPIHYTISSDFIGRVAAELNQQLHASNARLSARVRRDSLHTADEASDDGIIL